MDIISGVIDAVVGAAIGALFGAIFLRAGIWLFNKLAGPTSAVAEPRFLRAIVISFVALFVNFLVGVLFDIALEISGTAASADSRTMEILGNVVGMPVGMVVMAAILSRMLPTTFGRGLLITICQMLMAAVVGLVLAFVFIVLMGVM